MTFDQAYHSSRARAERELADRSADVRVSDAHLRLSALHLSRALLLEELERNYGSQDTPAPMPGGHWAGQGVIEL